MCGEGGESTDIQPNLDAMPNPEKMMIDECGTRKLEGNCGEGVLGAAGRHTWEWVGAAAVAARKGTELHGCGGAGEMGEQDQLVKSTVSRYGRSAGGQRVWG